MFLYLDLNCENEPSKLYLSEFFTILKFDYDLELCSDISSTFPIMNTFKLDCSFLFSYSTHIDWFSY
jgi:hypothetical protein